MTKLSVVVSDELAEAMDRKLVKGHGTRSAVIRRLIEAALREADEREDDEAFVRSYREHPQTEEELGWSDRATREHFAEIPLP